MAATSANRRQISAVLETTLGTTPVTPRMRQKLAVAETVKYGPTFVDSAEMRSDRMTSDSILVGLDSSGAISWEWHYPYPDSCEDFDVRSAFYNNWVITPFRDNDTAGSITSTTATTLVAAAGTNFALGHLVRTTGFAAAANNTVVRVTTAGSTGYTASAATYVVDASPAATARAKVVGFQPATAADVQATSTGLSATTLNFTTLGLAVGQWIKIGGTLTAERFATAANNARVRITAITATALTCDNLPTGWAVDAAAGKTIKVWFGDRIINGTTTISQTIERGDLGMVTPVYQVSVGMIAAQWSLSVKPKAIVTGSTTYMGMTTVPVPFSTTALDASIDAAPSAVLYPQFAGSANIGRVGEFGAALASPNWCIGFDVNLANNLNPVESLDAVGPQDLVPGECLVTGTFNTIFGDQTVLSRYQAGTPTSINITMQKLTSMVILTLPRVVLNSDGNPNAGGKNQLINVSFGFRASDDTALTNSIISLDRLEYYEA